MNSVFVQALVATFGIIGILAIFIVLGAIAVVAVITLWALVKPWILPVIDKWYEWTARRLDD